MADFTYDPDDDVVTLDDGTTIGLEYGDRHGIPYDEWDEWQRQATPWTIAITQDDEHLYPFWSGPMASEPTVLEALAMMIGDGELTGWSADPVKVADHYHDEVGETMEVADAIRCAKHNETLRPIIGHLDQWELENYDPEVDDDE